MVYTYKIGISEAVHDSFVKKSSKTNLLQSSQWAKVKNEWHNERLGFFKDGELVAVASVLIRKLVNLTNFTMIYIPRGPIMDYQDEELVSFVIMSLKEFGEQQRSIFIKFDPFLTLSEQVMNEQMTENQSVLEAKERLIKLGCSWYGRAQTLSDTIQPTHHAMLYNEYFSENLLNKRVRQNIRTARNKGVEIYYGREELLDDFSELLKKTERRKSINLRGKSYYRKILEAFPKDAYIVLAYLNVLDRYQHLLNTKENLVKESHYFTSNTRQSKIDNHTNKLGQANKEIEFLESELRNNRIIVPLAATLTIDFGETSENIYAGMDDNYKHYQPALLTWLETAKYAFERGVAWQNLGGVEPKLDGGLYHFKSHFNPIIEEYIGEFDLVVSPLLYKLFQLLFEIRKKLRKKD